MTVGDCRWQGSRRSHWTGGRTSFARSPPDESPASSGAFCFDQHGGAAPVASRGRSAHCPVASAIRRDNGRKNHEITALGVDGSAATTRPPPRAHASER